MNTNLPEHSNSNHPPKQQNGADEVDLIVLFNYIGKGISNIFKFIGKIFKYIFKAIIYALKPIVKYAKIIALIMVLLAVIGYFLDENKPDVFQSSMIVKPHFESKYKLIDNINYYNSLIANGEFKNLADILKIDEETAYAIQNFGIKEGPETETDRVLEYEAFLQSTDTATASRFTYDDFIESRDLYSTSVYEINVKAYKNNIFQSLEDGLNTTFENSYSLSLMEKQNKLYKVRKENIESSLNKIDSLQKVYISVLEAESQSQARKGMTIGDGLTFEKDKSVTKEFELFNLEVELRAELVELESEHLEEDTLFEVVTGFQSVGSIVSEIYQKYMLQLPILAFLMLYFIFVALKIIKFIDNYEG